jgi:hypothetical protein
MKKLSVLTAILFSLSAAAQKQEVKPQLDTLITGKVIFTDEKGVKYDVFRSNNGYSSIIINGKQRRIMQKETPLKPGAAEFAKSN